ncbi:hypothetical protein HanIR_Chr06g0272051 [Helianthus annuus]|nr:hypothetical protein HanIR_Chr06g0272051 [Helianthus annuus]
MRERTGDSSLSSEGNMLSTLIRPVFTKEMSESGGSSSSYGLPFGPLLLVNGDLFSIKKN